jgi:hypothetical protein
VASFKEAFAAARQAGKQTFTWNGKSYTTETAEEAAAKRGATAGASRPRRRPSEVTSPRPRRNPRAEAVRTEDTRGSTRSASSSSIASIERAKRENAFSGGDTPLNRIINSVRAKREVPVAPRTVSAPRRSSASRYQRGATGPRR